MHGWVWVLLWVLLSLLILRCCETIHLVQSRIVLVVELRLRHHYTRGYLVALVDELGIFHLIFGDLRAHTLKFIINWNLTNVCLRNNTSTLILIQSSVSTNTLNTMRCHWSISWWCNNLISNIYMWWRRVQLLSMGMSSCTHLTWLTKIIFSIWSFIH